MKFKKGDFIKVTQEYTRLSIHGITGVHLIHTVVNYFNDQEVTILYNNRPLPIEKQFIRPYEPDDVEKEIYDK